MLSKNDLEKLVVEALSNLGGSARIKDICKYVWDTYEAELRKSEDLFYTWQYEIRWAGQRLVYQRRMQKSVPRKGYWSLTKQ